MKRKSYPLWLKVPVALGAAVAIFLIGIGCIMLLARFLDMLGAKVH